MLETVAKGVAVNLEVAVNSDVVARVRVRVTLGLG